MNQASADGSFGTGGRLLYSVCSFPGAHGESQGNNLFSRSEDKTIANGTGQSTMPGQITRSALGGHPSSQQEEDRRSCRDRECYTPSPIGFGSFGAGAGIEAAALAIGQQREASFFQASRSVAGRRWPQGQETDKSTIWWSLTPIQRSRKQAIRRTQ